MRYRSFLVLLALFVMTSMALAGPSTNAAASDYAGGRVSTASLTQIAELTSSDGICDQYGSSVAADGDTVAVGAPFYDPAGIGTGAVYVYVKGSNGWSNMTQVARLTPSDGGMDYVGWSVAMSGDTIAAGAIGYTGSNASQGAVYVYTKPAGGWTDMTETARLTASDPVGNDQMGNSVGISGTTVVTSAKGEGYVFVKAPGGWASETETAKLTTSRAGSTVYAVAISGGTIVAADNTALISGKAEGAAFVYVRPSGGWVDATQNAVLTPSDGMKNGYFGQSVAISGSTIAVGAPDAKDGAVPSAGAAYVFIKPSSGWRNMTQTAKLTASPVKSNNRLGWSVATDGNTVVAGALQVTDLYGRGPGAAYLFSKPVGGWVDEHESAIFQASDGQTGDALGFGVALSNTDVVASAPFHAGDVGATYVF